MKKIAYYFISVFAAFSMVACQNKQDIELPEVVDDQEINLDITVAAPDGSAATKAVKKSWVAGDKISVWFDGRVGGADYVLTYDGASWSGAKNPNITNAWLMENLKTDGTGTMKYLYESVAPQSESESRYYPMGSFSYNGATEKYHTPGLILASSTIAEITTPNYSFDSENRTLTMNLAEWQYVSNLQIVVTDLEGDPEDWCMTVNAGSTRGTYWRPVQDISVNESYFRNSSAYNYAGGVANEDGIAFYFRNAMANSYNIENEASALTLSFTMIRKSDGTKKSKEIYLKAGLPSAYLSNGGTYSYACYHTFNAIKMSVTPTKKYLDGKFSVSASQQVNFATGNLFYDTVTGRFSVFGDQQYYVTADEYARGTNYISLFTWGYDSSYSKNPTHTSYVSSVTTGELPSDNDWSTVAMGSPWRTLTNSEWEYILNGRTMTNGKPRYTAFMSDANMVTVEGVSMRGVFLYPDNYSGSEVTSNTTMTWTQINAAGIVFLPAAGYRGADGAVVTAAVGKQAYYWTTTAKGVNYPTNAYYVNGVGLYTNNQTHTRSLGHSVRPVRVIE